MIYNGQVWPKITIITPSYNQGQYIEQTILSVLEQNYPNLEFIIIDGGSTDNTVEVIKKYEKHITYWISEKDRGQSHAINKGLAQCTGEIVNWLNSDDWLTPGALFKVAAVFQSDQQIMVVSGYENQIWPDGRIELSKGTFILKTLEETIELCEITQPSTFFRDLAFRSITPVPEDMHYIMDGELWVRFLLLFGQEQFYKLDEILVNFRLHENSKTVSNCIIDNFLIERSSIITDLQRSIGVPDFIINFWIEHLYNNANVRPLQRHWRIGQVTSKQKLKLYFIEKFINLSFIRKDFANAYLGIKELSIMGQYNFFLFKNILKLIVKRIFFYV